MVDIVSISLDMGTEIWDKWRTVFYWTRGWECNVGHIAGTVMLDTWQGLYYWARGGHCSVRQVAGTVMDTW